MPFCRLSSKQDPLFEAFPGYSPYSYGYNNPIMFGDPSGLAPEKHRDLDYLLVGSDVPNDEDIICESSGHKGVVVVTADRLQNKTTDYIKPLPGYYVSQIPSGGYGSGNNNSVIQEPSLWDQEKMNFLGRPIDQDAPVYGVGDSATAVAVSQSANSGGGAGVSGKATGSLRLSGLQCPASKDDGSAKSNGSNIGFISNLWNSVISLFNTSQYDAEFNLSEMKGKSFSTSELRFNFLGVEGMGIFATGRAYGQGTIKSLTSILVTAEITAGIDKDVQLEPYGSVTLSNDAGDILDEAPLSTSIPDDSNSPSRYFYNTWGWIPTGRTFVGSVILYYPKDINSIVLSYTLGFFIQQPEGAATPLSDLLYKRELKVKN